MKAKQWPNKLGWTIATKHGAATVWSMVNYLKCNLPIAPVQEWVGNPLTGLPRYVQRERLKICKIPNGTDPIEAIALCRMHGIVVDVLACYPREHDIPMAIGEKVEAPVSKTTDVFYAAETV